MTETILQDAEFDKLMTGEEEYPIVGVPLVPDRFLKKIKLASMMFEGLPLYAGCFEKAVIVQALFGGDIMAGAMRVVSGDGTSAYGFNYNPPLEQHCWLQLGVVYIDLSLPGVILRGLKSRDEQGPFLIDREPSILFGLLPDWLIYKSFKKVV